jgi:hypothetical protein
MKTKALFAIAVAAVAAVPVAGAGAASTDTATAAAREYEGTVVSKNRENRTFRLRDTERGTIRIKVTRNTRYERVAGFAGLKVGARNIEAIVRRSNGAWIALEVERSGGGGEHGGDDDRRGGDDDRRDDDDDRRGGDDDDRGGDDDNSGPGS